MLFRSAAFAGKCFVASPRDAQVVKDHVVAVGDAHRVRAARAVDAFAHADEAGDVVVRTGKGKAVAVDRHAVARRGLPGDGDVGLRRVTGRLVINHAADAKNNRASRNADGIAERSRAGVIGGGDKINRAAARSGSETPEALRAGEGGELG